MMGESPTVAKAVRRKYNILSHLYDHIWPGYIKKTIHAAVEAVSLNGSEVLLDIGCGTGALEETLAAQHPHLHVTGIDLSDEMLAIAQKKLACYPGIVLKGDDFLESELPENHFDAAYSISNFHYFPDPAAILQKTARLLKQGGAFVLVDWNRNTFQGRLYNRYMRFFDRGFNRAYRPDEVFLLLKNAGLRVESLRFFGVDFRWRMMCVVARKT